MTGSEKRHPGEGAPAAVSKEAFLPYGRQTIEDDDIAAVAGALRADYLTTGPTVAEFENAFAEAVGARYAVASNSGTAALHLAMLAIGAGPGDVAIVPSITFLATANAARYCGAEVMFADVDPVSGLMTEASLMDAVSKTRGRGRLKAILPVHLAGRMVDTAPMAGLAASQGAHLIADACHALGSTLRGQTPAQTAEMACYSFHPVKTMTTGEGGMTTAQDAGAAERMRIYRSHGMIRSPRDVAHYDMVDLGYNFRIPDILCALGLSQLAKLDRFSARRRRIAALYDQKLPGLSPHLSLCPSSPDETLHLYTVLIDFAALGLERGTVMARLREAGIGTQVHYIPVHLQPYYAARYGVESLPGAQAWHEKTLSLPLFPAMDDADVDRVVEALEKALRP